MNAITIVHWLAGLIVLAEALNKLERTDVLPALTTGGLTIRARLATILKAAAWGLLALGAAGAVITPLLHLETPTLQDACVMAGFAVLIVRTRVKETMDGQPQESDDFTQTRVFHAGKK